MPAKPMNVRAAQALAIMERRQSQHRVPVSERVLDAYEEYHEFCVTVDAGVPTSTTSEKDFYVESAPYQPGQILWVRESGKVIDFDVFCGDVGVKYLADEFESVVDWPERFKDSSWITKCQGIPNGIFKEAARTFLKVTRVWVERVQDISEDDCVAEGITADLVQEIVSGKFTVKSPQCWMDPDHSLSYCSLCAKKVERAYNKKHGEGATQVEGGYWGASCESDNIQTCEKCGALLGCSFTKEGVDQDMMELPDMFSLDSPFECYALYLACEYWDDEEIGPDIHKVGFHALWESIYPGSWDRNDWVWAYEFELTEKPAHWPE